MLSDEEGLIEDEADSDAELDSGDSFHGRSRSASPKKGKKGEDDVEVDPETVFTVHLSVERALHLPCVRQAGR